VRVLVLGALIFVTGCDALFGLTHVRADAPGAGDDDDGAVLTDGPTDAPPDAMVDAYVQKTCAQLGYNLTIGGSTSRYRSLGQTTADWVTAEADCEDDAAAANNVHTHLAVIGDDTEGSNVFSQVVFSAGDFWVGLSDRKSSNNFKWVTDESTGGYPPLTQPPWGTGEPSGGAGEDCVIISPADHFFDKTCTEPKFYACECDSHAVNPASF
jgi:hypothetical protein